MPASFDDLSSNVGSNGRPPTRAVDIELDEASSDSLVAEIGATPTDDSELSELLARLDSADIVATGVEARLDGILDTLDDLLTSLEPKDSDQSQEVSLSSCGSQSERPPLEQS